MRELRQHASRWLARVSAGESFEVTDRGRPVAVLAPVPDTGLARLTRAGAVRPGSGSLAEVMPIDSTDGGLTRLLAEDREDRV